MTQSPKDEKSEAIAKISEMKAEAKQDLQDFGTIHEFEMETECLDKNGEKTRVLILDTDCDGILGMFMEFGQPMRYSGEGEIIEDGKKLQKYISAMSNVDLSQSDNQKHVGWEALSGAREVAKSFFLLRLVSSIPLAAATKSE